MKSFKGENWGNVSFSKQKNLSLIPRILKLSVTVKEETGGSLGSLASQCVLLVSSRPMRDPVSEEVDGTQAVGSPHACAPTYGYKERQKSVK